MASKVSAFESPRVLTLPDVRVALWIKLEIQPALLLENGRKPRVVAPVRFHDHCIVWPFLAQKFIDGVLLPAGFQLAHSSDPSFRIVGRNNDRLRALSVCASSTHATSKPSSDLIDSAVESCIP